jgi:hypothetical protein
MLAAALPRTRRLQAVIPKKMLADILPAYERQPGRQEALISILPLGVFCDDYGQDKQGYPACCLTIRQKERALLFEPTQSGSPDKEDLRDPGHAQSMDRITRFA